LAGPPLHSAEMAEDRRRLVLAALALELELAAQEGVAAARIDHVARPHGELRAIRGDGFETLRTAIGAEGDRFHPHAVARVHAVGARVLEQQLVELRAPHLEGVVARQAQALGEAEHVGLGVRVGHGEIGAGLAHADRAHLLQHPEPLQDRQVHRQQGLADVEAGMDVLLQHQHLPAAPGQQGGGGAASRAAADHQHVGREHARAAVRACCLLQHSCTAARRLVRPMPWFRGAHHSAAPVHHPVHHDGTEHVPDPRRARTGRAAGREPEPGRRGAGRHRSGGAAVQLRPGPGLDRRAGAVAGDQQALRIPAALGQRGKPAHLRLAAGAVGTYRTEPRGLSAAAPAAPRPPGGSMILALEIALAVGYGVLAHLASARDSHALALLALLALVLLVLASPMAARRPWAWLALPLLVAGCWALYRAGHAPLPLLLVPVAFIALVAWMFGRTLRRGRMPLITRLVTVLDDTSEERMEQALVRYTRGLTLAWTLLLLA